MTKPKAKKLYHIRYDSTIKADVAVQASSPEEAYKFAQRKVLNDVGTLLQPRELKVVP